MNTLFLNKLASTTTEESLAAEILSLGFAPVAVAIMHTAANSFAYVLFANETASKAALHLLAGRVIDGQKINAQFSGKEYKPASNALRKPEPVIHFAEEKPAPQTGDKPLLDRNGHDLAYWSKLREGWRFLDSGKAQTSPLRGDTDKPAEARDPRGNRGMRKAA